MKSKILIAPALALSTLSLGACAQNYAVEGAGAGAALGAGLAALTDGDIETYANVARIALDAISAFGEDVRAGRQIRGAPKKT